MKVYIAAPYGARQLVAERLTQLTRIGYQPICRWADGTHEVGPEGAATEIDRMTRAVWANDDLQDVDQANILVVLTAAEALGSEAGTRGVSGGRHVETGFAIARGIPVILVGEPENVFHAVSTVTVVPTWHEAVIELAARLVIDERNRPQVRALCEPTTVNGL